MSFLRSIAAAVAVASSLLAAPAQAEDLFKAREAGVLRVAMSGTFPPFSFVDDANNVVGFDVDIGTEIAKRLGLSADIVTTPFDGIIAGLIAGKFDTVVGSMTITEERAKAIDFVGPYYHGGRGLFVPTGSNIQDFQAISGHTVAVTLGETHDKWAKEQNGWSVRSYKSLPEMLLEANAGRVDAIVADKIPVLVAIKEQGLPLRQIEIPGVDPTANVGIAIRKENPELKAAMQDALDAMMADGTYAAISEKWIGQDIR
ncbi:transporter substrate-binding domain-containing protein [Celeribacter sp. SCSIO 80788]|uniref:transporter substrate-binding domain-containing protein n=1 Tax=Celeribacter sp. SCSIO 80788 TaxID=3117013 RepID=UPI003DA462AA